MLVACDERWNHVRRVGREHRSDRTAANGITVTALRHAYYDRTAEHDQVPDGIRFGTTVLAAPDLTDLGVPKLLAQLPIVELSAAIGDWVERDQTILVARLPIFDRLEAPPGWALWVQDSFSCLEYELTSPVSGLLVDLLESYCAYHGDPRVTSSGRTICYEHRAVRPVILLPTDEPPVPWWSSPYYGSLPNALKVNRRLLLYSHREGYRRLWTQAEEFSERLWLPVASFPENEIPTEAEWACLDVNDLEHTVRMIGEMRAHDPVLRSRLSHIGGAPYSGVSEITLPRDGSLADATVTRPDVFISYASEDKDSAARPLYEGLLEHGLDVWFDETELTLGDSLLRKIDDGLARCRFGVVILSEAFFQKTWPERELAGLVARETSSGNKAVLPVWHGVDREAVARYSPILADRLAAGTEGGIDRVVRSILEVVSRS